MDNNLKWKNTLDICECRKGWNNLIAELMEKIEEIYKKNNISMSEDLEILQIKQKLGELIIYTKSSFREEIDEVLEEYRIKSRQVCEECGELGRLFTDKCWISTLCKKCAEIEEYDTSIE